MDRKQKNAESNREFRAFERKNQRQSERERTLYDCTHEHTRSRKKDDGYAVCENAVNKNIMQANEGDRRRLRYDLRDVPCDKNSYHLFLKKCSFEL